MKNKEKYAKEIVNVAIKACHFALNKDGKIVSCCDIRCSDCLFNVKEGCNSATIEWANAEYKEPKIFTEREKAFITLFPEIQYIARDKNNKIFGYHRKPFKDEEEGCWVYKGGGPDSVIEIRFWTLLRFESIQWEDEEPTSREEILGDLEMVVTFGITKDKEDEVVPFGIKEGPEAKGWSERDKEKDGD